MRSVGPILVGSLRSGASVGESVGLSRDTKSNPPRSLKNPAQIQRKAGDPKYGEHAIRNDVKGGGSCGLRTEGKSVPKSTV
jgi:hypothetical protein